VLRERHRARPYTATMNERADLRSGVAHYVDPLPFRLNGFLGVMWASSEAQDNWAPRLSRIRDALRDLECQSVAEGHRACALFTGQAAGHASLRQEAAAHGLSWHLMSEPGSAMEHYWLTETATVRVPSRQAMVIASDRHLADFLTAWREDDYRVVGRMLGIPACCLQTFHEVCGDSAHILDPTWLYAARSNPYAQANKVAISSGETRVDATNTLLRWIGLRAVPYFPCCNECLATADIARTLENAAQAAGTGREWNWLMTILSWPTEWTALHGIAEVKTPILKFRTATDATAGKYTVQWAGRSFPEDGAVGIGFPYRAVPPPWERRFELPLAGASKSTRSASVLPQVESGPKLTTQPRTIDTEPTEAIAATSPLTPLSRPMSSSPGRSSMSEEPGAAMREGIVIVGSGIKVPDHLTVETIRVLANAPEIWTNLPEREHAELARVIGKAPLSLWPFFQPDRPRIANYEAITAHLVERARAVRQVAYLTQGHPLVLDRVATELMRQGKNGGVPVIGVLPGISSIDTILADIRYEPARGLQVCDATNFVRRDMKIDGRAGLLLLQPGVFGSDMPRLTSDAPAPSLTALRDALCKVYPPGHPAILIRSGTARMERQRFQTTVGELDDVPPKALAASTLWVPPLDFGPQRPGGRPDTPRSTQS
jgi:precorrin-6B methylase 1